MDAARINGSQSWRIYFDDGSGDRTVSGFVGDGSFDDQNSLPLRLDAETSELAQAEGWMPERIEHQEISALDLQQSGLAHEVAAPPAVARLGLNVLSIVQKADPKTFFREVAFSGAHDASMRALLNGHVDAIASFDLAREQYLADPAERERITWVAETEPIHEAGIAARAGLDPATFARVRAALLQIRGPAYAPLLKRLYEIDGFAPADDHDYDPVRAAMDLLGVRPR